MMEHEPFLPRSFVVYSPNKLQRIYTTIGTTRILLTAENHSLEKWVHEGVLMGLKIDDSPNITVGNLLISLGIPVFGMITGLLLCPSPLDANTLRVVINYHPLPKPNIGNVGAQG